MKLPWITIFCLLAALPPLSYAAPHATVFRREEPKKAAYHMHRQEELKGSTRVVTVEFRALDGTPVVRERTAYENNRLKRYDYDQIQMKEGGFLEHRGDQVYFEFTDHSGKATGSDEFPDEPIIPDTIHSFLQRHIQQILAGDSVYGRFLLIERQDTVGFKFFLSEKTDCDGTPCLLIKMKPSSIIIAALVDPIWIRLEAAEPWRMISVDGRLAIREAEVPDPKGRHDYKAIDALLVFSKEASSSSSSGSSISSSIPGTGSGSGTTSKAKGVRNSRK